MSTTLSYLKASTNGFFKYRRRTPKPLEQIIGAREVIKALGTNETQAITKAIKLNNLINEAVELSKIQSIPKETIVELLKSELKLTTKKTKEQKKKLSYFIKLYLEQSNVTDKEYRYREYFFNEYLPLLIEVLFKKRDLDIEELTYDKLLKIRTLFMKLPSRNFYKYRVVNQLELVSKVNKGTLKIAKEHLLSEDTINKNLKRIKSLLFFAKELNCYSHNIPKTLVINRKGDISSRGEKAILTKDDLEIVFSHSNDNLKYLYEVSYYSGMRRSELYKCNIVDYEGVLCFDLKNITERLKTSSSYRLIPIHSKLLYRINEFKNIIENTKAGWISNSFSRLVKRSFKDTKGKSLYSLRHTFATNLIANKVNPEVISELMGHSHSTMTMSRYVKGYPIKTLREAIECL
ncbi:tyrosine-type recombinase/integrase [Arcobacter arenosus]|uniref:tyrosine-type recombinase/integrase n=1 Tax=Arcobacter arenosus TaxID=2576037 RepID=UPI003BA87B0C